LPSNPRRGPATRSPRLRAIVLCCVATCTAVQPCLRAFDSISASEELTAVSSKVYAGYSRTRLADGSLKPERYGFAIGGFLNSNAPGMEMSAILFTRDDTIDKMAFAPVARMIEGPLAEQKYFPTGDPKLADLLIVVFWGRTIGTSAHPGFTDPATLYGPDQDRIDLQNARLLGFDSEGVFDPGFGSSIASALKKQLHAGVMDAIKEDRYYVILRAFDFQSAWKGKRLKLLWETRFSLSQRRHDFGRDLPRMAQAASQFFGQDSNGLVQKPIPLGRVDIGAVRSLGIEPDK
jgi:hypothetical protein